MNHPFYVKGQGFIAAGKLSKGDEILNVSGGSYPVECVELEEKQEVVYNFQVEDYHTYYVGENSILVHNDCPEGETPTEGSKAEWDMAEGGGKINGREYSQHAMERMAPDTPSVIEDAIRNTTAVKGHTAGTFVHQTTDVTVIVNEMGKVITVIPK